MSWPLQSDTDQFYGNPRGAGGHSSPAWEAANLTRVSPPFKMFYAGKPVQSVKIHRKCAESLGRVFAAIWEAAKHDQATIDRWGVSIFGGSYNFRLMRGSSHLSMHSYGCALDLAPERFPMGRHDQTFVPQVIQAFANEGWENLPNDRMHFQAARVPGLALPSAVPVPAHVVAPVAAKPSVTPVKPAPVGIRQIGDLKMQVLPTVKPASLFGSLNILSLLSAFGGLTAVLPKIISEFGTAGLIAAVAMAVGILIQALIPAGTATAIENTVADTLIPAVEAFDPALKASLDQVAMGLHAAAAASSANTAATANNTAATVAAAKPV